MKSTEIEGLGLNDDGSFSLGGTPVPAEAEFPAVQLGDWTLSKALGKGTQLIANRGDGRRLAYEFKDGGWYETETDMVRRSRRNRRRPRELGDIIEQLKLLAAVSTDRFHWQPITEAEPHPYDRGPMPRVQREHHEGEIRFYNDGAVVLGAEYFPPGVGIDFYRFGGSIAYRERGEYLLIIASPGSIRFYYSSCRKEDEGSYASLDVTEFRVTRYQWVDGPKPIPPPKWLQFLFGGVEQSTPKVLTEVVSSSRLHRSKAPKHFHFGRPAHVYLSSERTVYVRIWEHEIEKFKAAHPDLQLVYLTTPWPNEQPGVTATLIYEGWFINEYSYSYAIPEPYVEITLGKAFNYLSEGLDIEAFGNYVLVNYQYKYLIDYFEKIKDSPSSAGDSEPWGYLVKRCASLYSFASWGGRYEDGGWDWFRLTPRHGVVTMPQLGSQPLKRLGQ